MTTRKSFHSMIKTLGFAICWPTQSQLQLTSLCICLPGLSHNNCKVISENVLICSWDKVSLEPKSLYASQVIIMRKKTGEIQLCINYKKLNSIKVRDAFPLPWIDEALQVVHNCQWFTSFDLAQGYLKLPVKQADIKNCIQAWIVWFTWVYLYAIQSV